MFNCVPQQRGARMLERDDGIYIATVNQWAGRSEIEAGERNPTVTGIKHMTRRYLLLRGGGW